MEGSECRTNGGSHRLARRRKHELAWVQHERFAVVWDRNLRLQGFEEAFTDVAIRG